MLKFKYSIFFLALLFALPLQAQIEAVRPELLIEPYIIDVKLKASGLANYEVKVTNNSERKLDLYPVVVDIDSSEGGQATQNIYDLDKAASVTRWIRFSRGVIQLDPGASASVPLELKVNLNAEPGKYYGAIYFPSASNRYQAEDMVKNSEQPRLQINVEVESELVEQVQLKSFATEKNFNLSYPVTFAVNLENNGNTAVKPTGSIFFYDRRGREIERMPVNSEMVEIGPGEGKEFYIDWSGNKKLGRFKARLELAYGQDKKRDIQDNVFFWAMPWPILFGFVLILFIVVFMLTYILFRHSGKGHHHQDPLARSDGVLDLKSKR